MMKPSGSLSTFLVVSIFLPRGETHDGTVMLVSQGAPTISMKNSSLRKHMPESNPQRPREETEGTHRSRGINKGVPESFSFVSHPSIPQPHCPKLDAGCVRSGLADESKSLSQRVVRGIRVLEAL